MPIISFQNLITRVLLSCATMFVVKYIDIATINILKNKKLTKTLVSINIFALVATALLLIELIIRKFHQINILLNLH